MTDVPIEWIGINLTGVLPKSTRGHEYILVIVDYTPWYPEALPHRKTTSKSVARKLVLLFSRVGISKELLTDQGMPFLSKLINVFTFTGSSAMYLSVPRANRQTGGMIQSDAENNAP